MNRKINPNQSSQNNNDYLNIFAKNDDGAPIYFVTGSSSGARTILENYHQICHACMFAQYMYSKYLSFEIFSNLNLNAISIILE